MFLPTFKKGIHPNEAKEYTAYKPIITMPAPEEVFIPLQQHIGAACEPVVQVGDEVKTGQVIGRSEKMISSPVHAAITGKVKAIDRFPHPFGSRVTMVHIKGTPEREDHWAELQPHPDWQSLSAAELVEITREAGIVGLGGAAFPTHVKLRPPAEKQVDSFILNGCECEPYLTADHRAMVELTDKVLTGAKLIMKALNVGTGYIGIENNKPDAIAVMQERIAANGQDLQVVPLTVKYPQGAEKMLIEAVLRRKVPVGGLPMDVGVVVNNVGTALAVAEAVIEGKPLIRRIVTVTGPGIRTPKNLMVRIGTRFREVLEFCDGLKDNSNEIFMGGPMMGMAQCNLDVPIVKSTSGIVCTNGPADDQFSTYPCIRCGSCVSACPVNLVPTRLARYAEKGLTEDAAAWGITNCMECGCCAFVCPSHIPLVQWLRVGKFRLSELSKN